MKTKTIQSRLRLVPPLFKVEQYIERLPISGCWIWTRSLTRTGYGQVNNGKMMEGAHRFSWRAHFGEIPHDKCVLHRCDVRCCVNPHHLYLGDHQQNMDDMMNRGRNVALSGTDNGFAKLTDDQVQAIRLEYRSGRSTQKCIAKLFNCSQQLVSRITRGEHR